MAWSRTSARTGTSSAAIVVLLALAGCSGSSGSQLPPLPAPVPSSTASTLLAGASASPDESTRPAQNDLKKGDKLKRTFNAGDVTVNVAYATTLPTKDWTPVALKPLSVTLTAIVNSDGGKKIYLTRVTVDSVVTSEGESLEAPPPLVDTANISPGYIVTFPSTYAQVFTIPAVDDGATEVSLNLTYEMLLQTDPLARDYQKQTATDTVIIPLT